MYQQTEFEDDLISLLNSPVTVEIDPNYFGEQVAKQFLLEYFARLEYANVLKENKIIDTSFSNYRNQISDRLKSISENALESNDYFICTQFGIFIYFIHLWWLDRIGNWVDWINSVLNQLDSTRGGYYFLLFFYASLLELLTMQNIKIEEDPKALVLKALRNNPSIIETEENFVDVYREYISKYNVTLRMEKALLDENDGRFEKWSLDDYRNFMLSARYAGLTDHYFIIGNIQKAIETLDTALEIFPTNSFALAQRALFEIYQYQNPLRAEQMLKVALDNAEGTIRQDPHV